MSSCIRFVPTYLELSRVCKTFTPQSRHTACLEYEHSYRTGLRIPDYEGTVALLHLKIQILLALYAHNGHVLAIKISSKVLQFHETTLVVITHVSVPCAMLLSLHLPRVLSSANHGNVDS
jgi:hypothetical protein